MPPAVSRLGNRYMIAFWLQTAIEQAYCAETAYNAGQWSEDNPSSGHCTLVAILLQELFGGDIIRADYKRHSRHYWNILPNGEKMDLTLDQFGDDVPEFRDERIVSPRALSKHQTVVSRYKQFKECVMGMEP